MTNETPPTPDAIVFEIDADALTVGDFEVIEDELGMGAEEVFKNLEGGSPSARLMRVLVYIVGRKQNPNFTMDDARNTRVSALSGGAKTEDTTPEPAGEDVDPPAEAPPAGE